MRRVLLSVLAVLACAAFVVVATGADDGGGNPKYWVELDNSFGLTEGADVKIAGVRAGKITEFKIEREHMRALVGIELTKQGFDDVRKDVFCETRPQSLIGEYFLDCQPGVAKERLEEGGTVPVEQTGSTVPVDLVNNIMRRPYRERFSIIISELGAALAARGDDLNETIRRASPALREVDRVLAILREQRTTIRDLYGNADRVLYALANNREDVTRFVQEARDTARASGSRADGIRAQFQRFPTFLRELRPTITLLGQAADQQRPALQNLKDYAPLLRTFLETLGPFSERSRPAIRSLAAAARTGRRALRAAAPNVKELRKFAEPLPEAATNLGITLEHLNDPKFATEKDERAGRGKDGGFTGFEALLRYVYAQTLAVNLFDANSYVLKAQAFIDQTCAFYKDAAGGKDPANAKCRAWLGPNQIGVTTPDPTKKSAARKKAAKAAREEAEIARQVEQIGTGGAPLVTQAPQQSAADPKSGGLTLPGLSDIKLPGVPSAGEGSRDAAVSSALDYLLGS